MSLMLTLRLSYKYFLNDHNADSAWYGHYLDVLATDNLTAQAILAQADGTPACSAARSSAAAERQPVLP